MAPGSRLLIAFALLLASTPPARAQILEGASGELPVVRPILTRASRGANGSAVANANCPQATCDTVWVGHSSSGPGGAFLGVGVGGVWDFDTDVAGTDSTQGWTRHPYPYTSGVNRPAIARPEFAYDYGNQINLGNTNLWHARDLAGRKYRRTGVISAWHADDMVGVKRKLNDGAEPSAVPIAGARSAWCGLRESGNLHAVDPITGNGINGDHYNIFGPTGPAGVNPDFPGFCSLWDQLLYKDFPSSGAGSLQFRLRTDMSNFVDTSTNGTGWFNPDPTSIANFVNNPADSFMVYVGSPTENAYDTNRRWISEILDFALPRQEVFSAGGKYPAVSPDTLITRAYAGIQPVGGVIRVVFRVKTNRVRADGAVGTATAYNSKDGAAVLDQVQVDAGPTYGFDAVGDILPRELAGDIAQPGTPWVGTGKPFDADFHIENIASLIYEDFCGGVGASTRRCNLAGNVVVAGRHDDGEKCTVELFQGWESPTIDLAVRTAPPGTKNAQGIDRETALRTSIVMDYDIYTGFMSFDESIFWYFGGRFHGPTSTQPQSGNRTWSPTQFNRSSSGTPIRCASAARAPALIRTRSPPSGSRPGTSTRCGSRWGRSRRAGASAARTWATRAAPTSTTSARDSSAKPRRTRCPRRSGTSTRTSSRSTRGSHRATTPRSIPRRRSSAPGSIRSFLRPRPGWFRATRSSPMRPTRATASAAACAWTWCSASTRGPAATPSRATAPPRWSIATPRTRSSPRTRRTTVRTGRPADTARRGTGTSGTRRAWTRRMGTSTRSSTAASVVPRRPCGWERCTSSIRTSRRSASRTACVSSSTRTARTTSPTSSAAALRRHRTGRLDGTTKEGTKILPDGWFTPGTHVEYF
jgi:hypothetical protein